MRVLSLCPSIFSFLESMRSGFEDNGCEFLNYDVGKEITKIQEKIHVHILKFPFVVREKWYRYFVEEINSKQLDEFENYKPEIVIAYNGMFLDQDTVKKMQKSSIVCFLLGDSPFFTPHNDFFLPSLMQADFVLCPDSYWEKQFRGMGHKGAVYFLISSNPSLFYRKEVIPYEINKWGSDLVFVGTSYYTAAGYKRALFLNQFSKLNIKIHINKGFRRWYRYFPDLEAKVLHPKQRISEADLNTMLNCCKIYPVDANPGILNGIHLRVFECIASGILPLPEYRKDIATVFDQTGLPIIRNYKDAAAMAEYYLKHEDERKDIINELRMFTETNFSPAKSVANLLNMIERHK